MNNAEGKCVSWYTADHPTVADKCAMILNICETLSNTINQGDHPFELATLVQPIFPGDFEELNSGITIIHEAVTQIIAEVASNE